MNAYIVVYDLNKPGQDYPGVIAELKRSVNWARPTESTWLIKTNESPKQVYERLARHLDSTSHVLINDLGPARYGQLSQEVCNWIAANLN